MEKFSFYSVIILNFIINVHYVSLTIKKKIKPSLAMWIFFLIAVVGSLFSYLLEADFTPWDNILNTSDVILCLSMVVVIAIYGDKSMKFNKIDYICLSVVGLILLYWYISKDHFLTHLSLQVIQTLAYIPVFQRMLKSKRNSESFSVWILVLLISVISLFAAKGILAYIYIVRAIVCVSLLLFFMAYLQIKYPEKSKDEYDTKKVG